PASSPRGATPAGSPPPSRRPCRRRTPPCAERPPRDHRSRRPRGGTPSRSSASPPWSPPPRSGCHALVVQSEELGTGTVGEVLQLLEPVLLGRVHLAVGEDVLAHPLGLLGADVTVRQDDRAQGLENQLLEGWGAGASLLARLQQELH